MDMVNQAIKDANVLVSKCFTEYKEAVPEYEIANAFAMLPLLLAKIDQQAARITELETEDKITQKQKDALDFALEYMSDDPNDNQDFDLINSIRIIRDMLEEAAP